MGKWNGNGMCYCVGKSYRSNNFKRPIEDKILPVRR